MTDPTAALAEALEQADAMLRRPADGSTRKRHRMGLYWHRDFAAVTVSLLPPDWCGHEAEIAHLNGVILRQHDCDHSDCIDREERLRKIEEAARAWRDADDAVLTLAGGPDYADEDEEVAAEERLDDAEAALRAALEARP